MCARRVLPVLLVLAAVAVGATGCFSSKVASTTISGEITVGEGSTAQTVNPASGGGSVGTNPNPPTTGGATSGSTGSTESTGGSGGTAGSGSTGTTGGSSGADLAAGKSAFTATCGGCHKLKDAGTTGNVGPDLDGLAPLTAERVASQIEHGGGAMPPKLLTGKDAANTAAYVASVAGK
jgi:cytochrome c553